MAFRIRAAVVSHVVRKEQHFGGVPWCYGRLTIPNKTAAPAHSNLVCHQGRY